MAKRMSKTLAAEIADRTLTVVNPQNRALALNAALQRHGFAGSNAAQAEHLADRVKLIAWLLATYAA
jgi:hypothetical protein